MEDSIIVNKGSIQRGFARSTFFRPYVTEEIRYSGGLIDEIGIPEKDVSGYRTEENYRFLEDDGVVYLEAELDEGDVVIGKVSPPKFLSEAREISIQTKKESSSAVKQEERGTIDAVFVTQDKEGIIETKEHLKSSNIAYVDHGQLFVKEIESTKFGIIGFNFFDNLNTSSKLNL